MSNAWIIISLCFCKASFVIGQNYQQCAANLACSINYEKIFQEKINNLGYHTTLQLQTLKHSLESKVTTLKHDIEKVQTNGATSHANVTQELEHAFRSLEHDRGFLNNLTKGIHELTTDLHDEQHTRFQDVRRLVEEINLVKQALGIQNNQSNLLPVASCEAKLNTTLQNATFFEAQYQKVMSMYNNLQTTVHDIRNQQHILLTQLQEKSREISSLQKQLVSSSPSPVRMSRNAYCGDAIGMEDGRILDTTISASESFGSFNPEYARLNDGRGWYTGAKSSSREWLNINFTSSHVITAVATQGAPCCEVWVTSYTLEYSDNGQQWHEYHHRCRNKCASCKGKGGRVEILQNMFNPPNLCVPVPRQYITGNTDQGSIKYQELNPPIVATFLRFNIMDFHKKSNSATNYIGMRTELYGCQLSVPKITKPHQ